MKKITLLVLLFASTFAIAQEKEEEKDPQDINKNHEIKINAFNLIAFSSIDLSYERLLNAESSAGVALFYNFSEYGNDDVGFPKKFSITPYYR